MIYSLEYTDNLPSAWMGGCASFWFIKIRPKYVNDQGLLAHELEHVRQWWWLLFLHPILYKYNRKYRLNCEVEAYKKQLIFYPERTEYIAERICTLYDLRVAKDVVLKMLT